MNKQLRNALIECETDVDSAVYRLSGNQKLYTCCLKAFLYDSTIEDLRKAIETSSWDEVFTLAHAFKGVTGNLGFVPLFQTCSQLLVCVRDGKLKEVGQNFELILEQYNKLTKAIREFING